MSDFNWSDPDLAVGGDFVKFSNVGDSITGTILNIKKHVFDDGSVAPQVLLKTPDGEEKTVSAGQTRLKAKLAEIKPGIGQTITITLTDIEKRSGGKTLKHFDVQIGGGTAAAAAPVAVPATLSTADLTDEQKAALAALGIK